MTIKEIEWLSGLTRANIRFYEQEGLLTPERSANRFRDYSESDLATLKRIKLLRNLNFSIDEIKSLQLDKASLFEMLSQKLDEQAQITKEATIAQRLCQSMRQDGVSYATLDAQKYLGQNPPQVFEQGYFTPREIDGSLVSHPWRRYLARSLDTFCYLTIWLAFLAVAFRTNLALQSNLGRWFNQVAALVMMLLLEPLQLHLFGTTLGKFIFGLRLKSQNGGKPSFYDGLVRTWDVIHFGLGFGIPIYNLVLLWRSYRRCDDQEAQPWDDVLVYSIRDTKWYRSVAFVVANTVLIGLLAIAVLFPRVPPNRGALTIAEFAENYNALAEFYRAEYYRLDQDGKWTDHMDGSTVYVGVDLQPRAHFTFIVHNDQVVGIQWHDSIIGIDAPLDARDPEITLAALSFIGAQKEVGPFSPIWSELPKTILANRFADFSISEASVQLKHSVQFSGYTKIPGASVLLPIKEQEKRFEMTFTMEKTDES